MSGPRAVALLSGGVDSTTTAAIALSHGFVVYGLTFDYGQRHRLEIVKAQAIAKAMALADHVIVPRGIGLGVDYALTTSCYDPSPAGEACGACDSCSLRLKGFSANGLADPITYCVPATT